MNNWLDDAEMHKNEQRKQQEDAEREHKAKVEAEDKQRKLDLAFWNELNSIGLFLICERIKKNHKPIEYSMDNPILLGIRTRIDKVLSDKYEHYDWGNTETMYNRYERRKIFFHTVTTNENTNKQIRVECLITKDISIIYGYKEEDGKYETTSSDQSEINEIVLDYTCDKSTIMAFQESDWIILLGWLVDENNEPILAFPLERQKDKEECMNLLNNIIEPNMRLLRQMLNELEGSSLHSHNLKSVLALENEFNRVKGVTEINIRTSELKFIERRTEYEIKSIKSSIKIVRKHRKSKIRKSLFLLFLLSSAAFTLFYPVGLIIAPLLTLFIIIKAFSKSYWDNLWWDDFWDVDNERKYQKYNLYPGHNGAEKQREKERNKSK